MINFPGTGIGNYKQLYNCRDSSHRKCAHCIQKEPYIIYRTLFDNGILTLEITLKFTFRIRSGMTTMIPSGIASAEEFPLAKWSETVQGLPAEQVAVLEEQLVQRVIDVINPNWAADWEAAFTPERGTVLSRNEWRCSHSFSLCANSLIKA